MDDEKRYHFRLKISDPELRAAIGQINHGLDQVDAGRNLILDTLGMPAESETDRKLIYATLCHGIVFVRNGHKEITDGYNQKLDRRLPVSGAGQLRHGLES